MFFLDEDALRRWPPVARWAAAAVVGLVGRGAAAWALWPGLLAMAAKHLAPHQFYFLVAAITRPEAAAPPAWQHGAAF